MTLTQSYLTHSASTQICGVVSAFWHCPGAPDRPNTCQADRVPRLKRPSAPVSQLHANASVPCGLAAAFSFVRGFATNVGHDRKCRSQLRLPSLVSQPNAGFLLKLLGLRLTVWLATMILYGVCPLARNNPSGVFLRLALRPRWMGRRARRWHTNATTALTATASAATTALSNSFESIF